MQKGRFKNPVEAVLVGVKELFSTKANTRELNENDSLVGKVCLITGANSGVGWGVAKLWASRGATIIMACRSGIPEKGEELKKLSGNERITMVHLDLTDFDKIDRFVGTLKEKSVQLDVALFNAGIATAKDQKTPSDLEMLFMVNYLSKFYLINRLLQEGIIPNKSMAGQEKEAIPRLLITSSDSHRNASSIDFDKLGVYESYGVKGGINLYSYYKLVLNTFSVELSKRLNQNGVVDVAVLPICPGPVNTNIVTEAPFVITLILKSIFSIFFQSIEKSAIPFLYVAQAPEMEGRTAIYHHMRTEKRMDEKVYNPDQGKKLWEVSEELIKKHHVNSA
jgi:NAD(P)-dependent dehydrogenase (short-subunit alcohol dehydrogenase family)